MHDFIVPPMPLLFSTTINISQPAARPACRLGGKLPSARGTLAGLRIEKGAAGKLPRSHSIYCVKTVLPGSPCPAC